MVFRVLRGLSQALDDRGRRRRVRIPDAKVDDIDSAPKCLLFHFVDGSEQVGRQGLDAGCDFNRETGHARALLC